MSDQKNFVFIPGAWHGAWAWHPVAQRAKAAGHRILALTMPGLSYGDDPSVASLESAVDHVVDQIERRDLTGVTLVAHSWGGYPATGAAHRLPNRIAKMIYFSAVVPTPGMSMVDELAVENAEFIRASVAASSDGTVSLPFELYQQMMIQGESESLQRAIFGMTLAQPGRYMLDAPALTSETLPSGITPVYILAEDDQALARPGTEFAGRLGVEPVMVPGTHESLLTHPDELVTALLSA